jgi:hypothetical protein
MRRSARPFGSRVLALLRVLCLLGVGLGLGTVLLLSAARARASDVLVELGAQLLRLPGARYSNGVQALSLNGLTLFVQSGSSERSPEQVVEQFHAACARSAAPELAGPPSHGGVPAPPGLERLLDGVLVEASRAGTAIACIDAGGASNAVDAVVHRLQRFFASGDLGELGRLRYAWVERGERGGSAFLTLWSDGSVALLDRFPPDRDAPGADLPGIERVGGSRRVLSAALETSALGVYEHRASEPEPLLLHYRGALERAGYRAGEARPPVGDVFAQVFHRPGRELVLVVQSRGGISFVTLLTVTRPAGR